MQRKTVLILLITVLVTSLGWVLTRRQDSVGELQQTVQNPKTEQRLLTVGERQLWVEVRNDEAERALGFSYRTELKEDEGMLFIFPEAAVQGFWMKGMEFDLDMIWIRDGVIVEISKEVPAPKNNGGQIATVNPKEPANWVLEVVGGWSERNGVSVGDEVNLEKK